MLLFDLYYNLRFIVYLEEVQLLNKMEQFFKNKKRKRKALKKMLAMGRYLSAKINKRLKQRTFKHVLIFSIFINKLIIEIAYNYFRY